MLVSSFVSRQNQIFLTRTLFKLIYMTLIYQVRNLIAKASAVNILAIYWVFASPQVFLRASVPWCI